MAPLSDQVHRCLFGCIRSGQACEATYGGGTASGCVGEACVRLITMYIGAAACAYTAWCLADLIHLLHAKPSSPVIAVQLALSVFSLCCANIVIWMHVADTLNEHERSNAPADEIVVLAPARAAVI